MNHPYLQTFNLQDFCKPAQPAPQPVAQLVNQPNFTKTAPVRQDNPLTQFANTATSNDKDDKHEKAKKQKKLQAIYNDIEKVLSHY